MFMISNSNESTRNDFMPDDNDVDEFVRERMEGMMPPIQEDSKDMMDESKIQKDSLIKKSKFEDEDYDLSSKFDLRKDFGVELNQRDSNVDSY